MKLTEQPIQSQFTSTVRDNTFVVLKQEQNIITVIPKQSSAIPLNHGNLIRFSPDVVGIVVNVNKENTTYTVLLNFDHQVKEGKKIDLVYV